MGASQSLPDATIVRVGVTEKCSHTPVATVTSSSFASGEYLDDESVKMLLAEPMFGKFKPVLELLPKYASEMFGDQVKDYDVVIRHPCGYSIVALRNLESAVPKGLGLPPKSNAATHFLLANLVN